MTCTCVTNPVSGNDTSYIPVKIGEPLSTACERASVIGAIPEVLRYPGFTLVGGATAATKISNGGIGNLGSFFKTRSGCYYDMDSRLSGSNCL